jgi:hypothetical protein
VGNFQIDFLYFHQSGIFHIEIKTTKSGKKDDEQLEHNRDIVKDLFVTFCRLLDEEMSTENLWETFFCQSFIFYGGANVNESRQVNSNATFEEMISSKIWGKNN